MSTCANNAFATRCGDSVDDSGCTLYGLSSVPIHPSKPRIAMGSLRPNTRSSRRMRHIVQGSPMVARLTFPIHKLLEARGIQKPPRRPRKPRKFSMGPFPVSAKFLSVWKVRLHPEQSIAVHLARAARVRSFRPTARFVESIHVAHRSGPYRAYGMLFAPLLF